MIRNLRIERYKRGLSLSAVAQHIGITKQSLASIELGIIKNPTYRAIVGIEQVFLPFKHDYLLAEASPQHAKILSHSTCHKGDDFVGQSNEGGAKND